MSRIPGMLLLVFGMAASTHAQQQQGDVELQFQGSFFTTVGGDITSSVGTLSGKLAPFLTQNIQVGIGPTLSVTTSSTTTITPPTFVPTTTSSTKWTFGTTAFVAYSFLLPDARTVPYLGLSYYKRDFSKSADKGWVGGNGGVRFYFTKRTAADFSANYLFSLNAETRGGSLLFAMGLSFLL